MNSPRVRRRVRPHRPPVNRLPTISTTTEMTTGVTTPLEVIDGIRREKVARLRQEILAGTYDTPERLELACERLFEHLEETL